MTARRRARRPRRGDREHGQALIFVALGMVAMLVTVGLAIDGGKEAANYRVAQNGTDAGALSAATKIYESLATASKSTLCDIKGVAGASADGTGPTAVRENRSATPTACHPLTTTSYVADGPNGFTGKASLATADTTASVAGLACVTAHVTLNDAGGSTVDQPNPQSATGTSDLATVSAGTGVLPLLGPCSTAALSASTDVLYCQSGATGPGLSTQTAPSVADPCSSNTSASLTVLGGLINVGTALGITMTSAPPPLLQQQTTSTVPTNSQPSQSTNSIQVLGTGFTVGAGGISAGTVTATAGSTSTQVGTPNGHPGVDAHVNLTNVAATIEGIGITAKAVDMSLPIVYVPGQGFSFQPTCTVANAGLAYSGGGLTINGTLQALPSNCNYSAISVPGVLSVASTSSGSCTTIAGGIVHCTASACLLSITVLTLASGVANLSFCIGSASADAYFKPVTPVAAVEILDTVATPTYFLQILGVTQTNPSATSAAMPQQVIDESNAAFASAPIAAQYLATPRSDVSLSPSSYCTAALGIYQPVIPGCVYQLYNAGAATVDPNPGANFAAGCVVTLNVPANCWKGGLAAGSKHKQGQYVTFSSSAPAVSANYGTAYVLAPIIDNRASGTEENQPIREYGLFLVDLAAGTGKLLNTPDPANNVVVSPVASDSTTTWAPGAEGAVAVKLADPAYLKGTLGFIET